MTTPLNYSLKAADYQISDALTQVREVDSRLLQFIDGQELSKGAAKVIADLGRTASSRKAGWDQVYATLQEDRRSFGAFFTDICAVLDSGTKQLVLELARKHGYFSDDEATEEDF